MYLVELSGPLTGDQANALSQTFKELAERGAKQVIIDMQDVPFIDSRGLGALLSGYRAFSSAEHDFRLAQIQDQPRLVFDLTGFNHVFKIFDSVVEAVTLDREMAVPLPWQSSRMRTAAPA
jgi:anti-sigma B factor antagonist